jgi:hypothetical protein
MPGNPFRSRLVPDSVSREIEARADGAKLLKWTAQRFPWIYVQSCAGGKCSEKYNELGNDPDVGGKALYLFGNNTSLAAYDKSTKQPLPYVESMDVKAMGSLGTTRKASIKIKAFTDEQLVELQYCFFVPGMDVRVQWGWNKSCTGEAPPPVLKNPSEDPALVLCKINKLRKQSSNYDGFHGIVSNFKYSLDDKNTWDCETGSDVDGSWYQGWFAGEETEEYWISFAAFIDMLNVLSIPSIEKDKTWPFGKVDVNSVLLAKPSFCASADPRVCYIDGGNFPVSKVANGNTGGTAVNNAIVTDDSGKRMVRLGSIMCNVLFLNGQYKQVYDGDGNLKTLIDNVLREINRVCGNPWNFVTIATETDCGDDDSETPEGPTITILDDKQAQRHNQPFNVPGKVDSSVLRKWSLAMKMTGAMKTQALYAGNSQKTRGSSGNDSSGCTGTAVAPFYSGNQITNKAKPKPSTASVDCNDCDKGSKATDEPTFQDLIDDMWYEVNDQTVAAMQAHIDRKVSGERTAASCAGVPLPFDFSFTLDGIGGFEFGQMVTSDRIPKEVRENFRWQVTKVEHSVTANDWETTISTVCRSNPYGEDQEPGRAN